jgi:hypothetical protein
LLVPILLGIRRFNLGRSGYLPRGLMLGHFVLWYGLLRLGVDHFRDYDSYWLGIGRGQYFNLLMAVVGLCMLRAVRRHASPKPEKAPMLRNARKSYPALWVERAAFYALVALCLSVPSGWTQQVLDDFEARREAATPAEAGCGGDAGEREPSQS